MRFMPSGGGGGYREAKELRIMPDYSNQFTKMTEERLGSFCFDEYD